MLTLYHAPQTRSSRIVRLIHELGIRDRIEIRPVTIPRHDGSCAPDPANPHPEKKVPFLVHDGVEIRESNAIIQYLCDLFPQAGLAPSIGDPLRGRYLSWLAWYGNVVEPVMVLSVAGVEHPLIRATFRTPGDVIARLTEALTDRDWLVGDRYGAADLLLASPYEWNPAWLPEAPAVRDWFARCQDRASTQAMQDHDAALLAPAA